jgi:hypothetical protein
MMSDYLYISGGEDYERVTHVAGVKTTICKNRFEVICADRAEVNEERAVAEFKSWIKRREAEMREPGPVSE